MHVNRRKVAKRLEEKERAWVNENQRDSMLIVVLLLESTVISYSMSNVRVFQPIDLEKCSLVFAVLFSY